MKSRLVQPFVAFVMALSLVLSPVAMRSAMAKGTGTPIAMADDAMPCDHGAQSTKKHDHSSKPCSDMGACFANCCMGITPFPAEIAAPVAFSMLKQDPGPTWITPGRIGAPPSRPPKL